MQINIYNVSFVLNDINVTLKLSELDSEPYERRVTVSAVLESLFVYPAQTDLLFMDDGSLIGSVLVSLHDKTTRSIFLHLVYGDYEDERWVIKTINTMEIEKRQGEVLESGELKANTVSL
jgi:hypothetical protein